MVEERGDRTSQGGQKKRDLPGKRKNLGKDWEKYSSYSRLKYSAGARQNPEALSRPLNVKGGEN